MGRGPADRADLEGYFEGVRRLAESRRKEGVRIDRIDEAIARARLALDKGDLPRAEEELRRSDDELRRGMRETELTERPRGSQATRGKGAGGSHRGLRRKLSRIESGSSAGWRAWSRRRAGTCARLWSASGKRRPRTVLA